MVQSSDKKDMLCCVYATYGIKKYSPLPPFLLEAEI